MKGEDDTVTALEGPQPRRGDETRGQITPNRANTRGRGARKDPGAAGARNSWGGQRQLREQGATEDAPQSVREILSAGGEREKHARRRGSSAEAQRQGSLRWL